MSKNTSLYSSPHFTHRGFTILPAKLGLGRTKKKGVLFGVLILCLTKRGSMAPADVVDNLLVGRHNLRASDEVLARPGLPSASQDLVGLPEF